MNHSPTNDFQDLTEALQILKCGAQASHHIKLIVVSRWLFVIYKQQTMSHYQLNYAAELLN